MRGIFILILMLISIDTDAIECSETRAAIDIGSGTTKLVVAIYNKCTKTINAVLEEISYPVRYKNTLIKSDNKNFDYAIKNKGLKVLKKLKDKALKYSPSKILAVATASFRVSKNGKEFINEIKKKIGIDAYIITKRTEAILGYLAAYTNLKSKNQLSKNLLIWDVGAGSMQFTYLDKSGNIQVYSNHLASESLKNQIIKKMQKRNIKIAKSPNPIGRSDAKKALNLVKKFATKRVPSFIRNNARNMTTIGIGGVHYYSIRDQVKSRRNTYSQAGLFKALIERSEFSDKELASKYAPTQVSNLILIGGFMSALKIKEILPIKVNLANGAIAYPTYWE